MLPIGERLREARMRQDLDITEVEIATKIRAKYLRALENDEFAMLPGSTYVKSFLRTYAEYLGLDAQLLVEEFRAQHEPRGVGEAQTIGPPARARPVRDRRAGIGGSPVGPGGALAIGIGLILLILAVIGFASGGGDGGGKKAAEPAKKKSGQKPRKQQQQAAADPQERAIKLKIVPSETTYLCVHDGRGTTLFEGTIATPQTFRDKRRLLINLGRSSATLYLNGERYRYQQTSDSVGFEFSRTGRVTPLALGDRPCG